MNVIIRTAALSKQADGYLIKNPHETTNAHTIVDPNKAADVLKLRGETSIDELKAMIRGVDFTSISTRELAKIGSKLYELGLMDGHVADSFIAGHMAYDEFGQPADRDVEYNAIAMFSQMLDDHKAYARDWPMYAQQESFKIVTRALLGANQAINALFYFAHSDGNDLSVSINA